MTDRIVTDQTVSGEFEVKLTPSSAPDAPIGEMIMAKTFRGPLSATGKGRMLAVRTETEGSAGYVAMEVVSGSLDGRTGTFALQHSGTMARGAQSLLVTVVPDSATGELAGLSGSMAIRIEGDRHFYDLRYNLPH